MNQLTPSEALQQCLREFRSTHPVFEFEIWWAYRQDVQKWSALVIADGCEPVREEAAPVVDEITGKRIAALINSVMVGRQMSTDALAEGDMPHHELWLKHEAEARQELIRLGVPVRP